MNSNRWFVILTTLCLTIGSAFAAPVFDPSDPPEPGTYSLTVNVADALMGSATGTGMYADGTNVTITATPNSGYLFLRWDDGSTTNPRTVTIRQDSTFTAFFEAEVCVPQAGECGASGDNLTWALSCDGELVITGSGDMTNYANAAAAPWYAKRNTIVSVSLPAGMTSIGAYAFFGFQNLTTLSIPDAVTSIGAYAFSGSNVRELSLPEGLMTLAEGSLMGCQSLHTIELPSTLTAISNLSLAYCGALARIDCNAATPPTLGATAFEGDCYSTVHVPCAALEDYKGASGWSSLDDILPQTTVTITYTIASNDVAKGTVAITGITEYCDRTELTATATPLSGYEFVKWSDENTTNPRPLVMYADLDLTAIFQIEVDPGNLRICLGVNSFIVENNPYAADIVIHNAANTYTTSIPRTSSPQTIDLPAEWPAGDYIVEFNEGDRAFVVTKL